MTDYYLGEIRLLAFDQYAPVDFLPCDGRPLNITANQALFALIGTTYGGDGVTTFNIPDLRGRAVVHLGPNPSNTQTYALGAKAGTQGVIVGSANLAPHTHVVSVSNQAATTLIPGPNVVHGNVGSGHLFYETTGTTDPIPKTLATDSVTNANNSQTPTDPHNNIQPCLALAYVICTNGLFPQSN